MSAFEERPVSAAGFSAVWPGFALLGWILFCIGLESGLLIEAELLNLLEALDVDDFICIADSFEQDGVQVGITVEGYALVRVEGGVYEANEYGNV